MLCKLGTISELLFIRKQLFLVSLWNNVMMCINARSDKDTGNTICYFNLSKRKNCLSAAIYVTDLS